MKTKRILSALSAAVVAVSALPMSVFAISYSYPNGVKNYGNYEEATVKPTLTLDIGDKGDKAVYKDTSEISGKTITCKINVSGANEKYCSTGFFLFYDSRLTLASEIKPAVAGDALAELSGSSRDGGYVNAPDGYKGVFFCTGSPDREDSGLDGTMWEIKFIVPPDVQAGDVFAFDISYFSSENSEGCFTNVDNNNDMQAYAFTKGIYNPDNPNSYAASASELNVPRLADISTDADGFIAIEDEKEPEFAGTTDYPDGKENFGNSAEATVKPVLTITVDDENGGKVYDLRDIAGKKATINICVAGAEKHYSCTGLAIYYDERLKPYIEEENYDFSDFGNYQAALEQTIEGGPALGTLLRDDPAAFPKELCPKGMDGFFVVTTGKKEAGKDGVMWSFDVRVPEDAKNGDLYPIDISYLSSDLSKGTFSQSGERTKTPESMNMQAYVFTHGIYHKNNPNSFAQSTDAENNAKLASISGDMDGYIAIADVPSYLTALGTCGDNITWELDKEGTLTINGTGELNCIVESSNDSTSYTKPWGDYNNDVKKVVVSSGITSIGDYVFNGSWELTEVSLPDTLTSIGENAFSLCKSLTKIDIPDSVTTIDNYAFCYCDQLTSIEIPASVTKIGINEFNSCPSLKTITILNPELEIKALGSIGAEATIRGYKGSTAEAYADEHDIKFEDVTVPLVKFGDPNNDGFVNAKDASFVLGIYAQLSTGQEVDIDEAVRAACDVKTDNKIDAKDATIMLSYYSYLSTGGKRSLEDFIEFGDDKEQAE